MNVGVMDERVVESKALTPCEKTGAEMRWWFPTQVIDHPSDENLSLGTPESRQDGARKFCGWSEKGRALAVAAAVVAFAAMARGQHFKVDAATSEVHFTLGASDGPVNGTFHVTGGEFALDPGAAR